MFNYTFYAVEASEDEERKQSLPRKIISNEIGFTTPISSAVGTSDSEGNESASDSEQNDPPASLASDAEQYELMQASYVAVDKDFHDQ